jgi:aspartate/methionine/tyrosine aminotransferase
MPARLALLLFCALYMLTVVLVQRELERVITPKTVGMYLNPIHNPTGRVLPTRFADQVARVAKRHDLVR